MKKIVWLGSSLEDLKTFSDTAKREAGYWLHVIQEGKEPFDTKPMPVGVGVKEIRIHEQDEYRVILLPSSKALFMCFMLSSRKHKKHQTTIWRWQGIAINKPGE